MLHSYLFNSIGTCEIKRTSQSHYSRRTNTTKVKSMYKQLDSLHVCIIVVCIQRKWFKRPRLDHLKSHLPHYAYDNVHVLMKSDTCVMSKCLPFI